MKYLSYTLLLMNLFTVIDVILNLFKFFINLTDGTCCPTKYADGIFDNAIKIMFLCCVKIK